MTHDPLCPMSPPDPAYCCTDCDGYECECDLIAKVKAECIRIVEGAFIPDAPMGFGWNQAVRTAIEYLKGEYK